jgi:predicted CXXCH cytochrome family protein
MGAYFNLKLISRIDARDASPAGPSNSRDFRNHSTKWSHPSGRRNQQSKGSGRLYLWGGVNMESTEVSLSRSLKRALLLASLIGGLLIFFLPGSGPSIAQAEESSSAPEVAAPVETMPASSECSACHEQIAVGFARTVHGKVKKGELASCETCHGNGAEHIAGGGDVTKIKNPAKLRQSDATATCTQCHSQSKGHALWRGSKHDSAGLSCLSCHSAHHSQSGAPSEEKLFAFVDRRVDPRSEGKLLKARNEAETCFKCHGDLRKAQFQRSTHLFRNEDRQHRMNCSSCHEPHGSIGAKMMRTASVNETCYQCHSEKRGPFLWEHAPVREDCSNCHKAHGSNQAALLQTRAPMLCQQCHIQGRHQTVAGLPNSAWVLSRSCLNCHPAVHGSNHPSGINLQR